MIREHGVFGKVPFVQMRTPGFGDSDWTRVISELRLAGYKGAIDIEGWHDPVYRDALEMTGQVMALNHLKQCRGGTGFVDESRLRSDRAAIAAGGQDEARPSRAGHRVEATRRKPREEMQ